MSIQKYKGQGQPGTKITSPGLIDLEENLFIEDGLKPTKDNMRSPNVGHIGKPRGLKLKQGGPFSNKRSLAVHASEHIPVSKLKGKSLGLSGPRNNDRN